MALRDPHLPIEGGKSPGPAPPEPKPFPERFTWVSYSLLAGSVGWFAVQLWLTSVRAPADVPTLMLYGPLVRQGEWWRVLATAFEHAGLLHLAFNMSAVWTLGRILEIGIGTYRMLITSVVGALGSALFVLAFSYEAKTVGASGVILSWAGAILPIATQQGRKTVGVWLVQVLVISLLPGVSWQGHLGGFLFGIPCGLAMRLGRERFGYAAPVLVFVAAALVLLVGSGTL